ncbi:MAG: chemotaxis protein CheW [bacterium]
MIDNEFLSPGQKEIQMIIFQLGNEEYAVPITCVQEIIMLQTATRIPKAPSFVEGIINLRGKIILIIDGKKKFQLETGNDFNVNNARIMVLEIEGETIGLIVDAVSEVIHLKTKDIYPPPIDTEVDSDLLWGIGKFHERLLILLNPQKFLTVTETKTIKKLAKLAENIDKTKEPCELTV